ncbi:hypothetical protein JOC75_003200 [Metabacillus crassostreae]|uniref:DUF4176 domain-containing protein n=1 Tax=Metabacillus crassostreae TaxID=929098 RepID=UPI00195AD0C0|nr:DUF4176 domain-containing protein [Metabacillus crassostreae]MBM7605177.1 hypothetical protein [Metabacillus crassostreae]
MKSEINSLELEIGTDLLPIGTVVSVEVVKQAVMIYGRKQQQEDNDIIWDYVGCPYPQGHLSHETNVFFNQNQIIKVEYRGLETKGELFLRDKLNQLDR